MEDKRSIVDGLVTSGMIALIGFAVKVIVKRKQTSVWTMVLDSIAAVVVGVFVGNIVFEYDMPLQIQIAIISLAGMLGPDILAGILVLTAMFANKPSDLILDYLNASKGRRRKDDVLDLYFQEKIAQRKEEEKKEEKEKEQKQGK